MKYETFEEMKKEIIERIRTRIIIDGNATIQVIHDETYDSVYTVLFTSDIIMNGINYEMKKIMKKIKKIQGKHDIELFDVIVGKLGDKK